MNLTLYKVVDGKKKIVKTDGTLKSIFSHVNSAVPNGFWEGQKNGFVIFQGNVPVFVVENGSVAA